MKIAADFTQRVVVHSQSLPWIESPMLGVSRRALDRVGDEVARATTIVRYAPGSNFSSHVHTGGEEFIVLDGVFQDEHGDYPVGSYIRNPPESSHTPRSEQGCIIFVKLWQFQLEDRTQVRCKMDEMNKTPLSKMSGVFVTSLHHDDHEDVDLYQLEADAKLILEPFGGAEIFVLAGEVTEQQDTLSKHSWVRLPVRQLVNLTAGALGATLWIKTNHLLDVDKQIERVNHYNR